MEDLEDFIRRSRRKKRREGALLTLLGIAFVMTGAFLLFVVESPWMGAMSICFGLMGVLVGIVETRERTTLTTDILMTVACFMFAATGAMMILAEVLTPEAWGWRSGTAVVIIGSLALAFFGSGTVILVIKCVRRYRAR